MATPQIQNETIYPLPRLYIQGLQLSAATPTAATVIAVSPGAARDSTNSIDMVVGLNNYFEIDNPAVQFQGYQAGLFVNSAINGVNGLDTGTIAASTQYAVYLIGDSRNYKNTAAVLSLTSNTAPLLPSGYDSYRLIGFWATDGSSHFVYATNKPQNIGGLLTYFNSPAVSVLSGGTATSFTAIDLTTNSAIPTTTLQNIIVTLLVTFTPAAVGDTVQFRPTGSSATGGLATITGLVAGFAQTQYIQVIAGVGSSKPEIDYKVTSGSDAVSVAVAEWAGVSNSAYPALV
ncbi:MAG TPA: hypothetical protein VGJ00_10295 [Rhabdochlamydiaceae bacterium]|jgi:hypothetical protein